MTLPKDFWEQLPRKSDQELYDMIARPEDYVPEALSAAQDELGKRKLSPARTAQLEAEAESQKAADEGKAAEPLGWGMRILLFLFCAGLVGAVLGIYYESKGYKQKAQDCWITIGLSLLAHFVFGLLFFLGE